VKRSSEQDIPDNSKEPLVIHVGHSISQRRIDKYLHGRFGNYSRAMLQNIISAGGVKVNGCVVKQSFKLTAGDIIELSLPKLPSKQIEPEQIPLDII
jgi:23S rRNA pseudouridine1911/1915/1917 synthase